MSGEQQAISAPHDFPNWIQRWLRNFCGERTMPPRSRGSYNRYLVNRAEHHNQMPRQSGHCSLAHLKRTTPGVKTTRTCRTGKEAFLQRSRSGQSDDYLKATRSPPLSAYEIKAGWEIPAILEQALNSDLPGELKALVTSNVYDTASGRFVLIPQGSRLVGVYNSRVGYGQDGVQVIWDRVIYPDGSSLDLSGMIGQDSHGFSGFREKVDRHYKRLIGFAVLTSLFAAASEISQNQNRSLLTTPSAAQVAGSSVGQQASELGAQVTRRNLNVQPTIKIPIGYRFNVRVNRDIAFEEPYAPIQISP